MKKLSRNEFLTLANMHEDVKRKRRAAEEYKDVQKEPDLYAREKIARIQKRMRG
jgi:hypothetical protein